MKADLVIIGAGPAGLAAAFSAAQNGVKKILIVERDKQAGGILNQCIHSGFGLSYFKQELTGPEFALRLCQRVEDEKNIGFMFDAMALSVSPNRVTALSAQKGLVNIETKAVILAMGCRERTRPAIAVPGTRPSGVMTAGLAQRYINIEGKMIGKRAVILGSGDIGMIMARRLTLEGAKVLACLEIMPYSSGLARNIAQCLDDFGIPLLLSHTVTGIHGRERLSGVTVSKVDAKLRPIKGTEFRYDCDTLLLSVGLIPENELSAAAGVMLDPVTKGPVVFDNNETNIPGIFACGNVLQVHDLVDYAAEEGERAGKSAAEFIYKRTQNILPEIKIAAGENVGYAAPQKLRTGDGEADICFRVKQPVKKGETVITSGGKEIRRIKRAYMSPGEMERFKLQKSLISEDVTISVEVSE